MSAPGPAPAPAPAPGGHGSPGGDDVDAPPPYPGHPDDPLTRTAANVLAATNNLEATAREIESLRTQIPPLEIPPLDFAIGETTILSQGWDYPEPPPRNPSLTTALPTSSSDDDHESILDREFILRDNELATLRRQTRHLPSSRDRLYYTASARALQTPDPNLIYDDDDLFLPHAYMSLPRAARYAFECLNPHHLRLATEALPSGMKFAIEDMRIDTVNFELNRMLREAEEEGGGYGLEETVIAAVAATRYMRHVIAVSKLRDVGMKSPYEEREYKDLVGRNRERRYEAWKRVYLRRDIYIGDGHA